MCMIWSLWVTLDLAVSITRNHSNQKHLYIYFYMLCYVAIIAMYFMCQLIKCSCPLDITNDCCHFNYETGFHSDFSGNLYMRSL